MTYSPKENPNSELAIESQQKFDFYFTALIFTILGFSLQTGQTYLNRFEKISWIVLLISGICALSRLEFMNVIFRCVADIQEQEKFYQQKPSEDIKKSLESNKAKLGKLESKMQAVYCFQRVSFVVGISLLVASRILPRCIFE